MNIVAVWDEGLSIIVFASVCVNSLKVKGGWTAFQMRVAMAGRSGFPASSAVQVAFSSHRQSSTESVVVTATCAMSPLSQITSKIKVPKVRIADCWNVGGGGEVSGLSTSFTRLSTLNEEPSRWVHVVLGETDKKFRHHRWKTARNLLCRSE